MRETEMLRRWVRSHMVCLEVAPRHESWAGQPRVVGFDVVLLARLPSGASLDPGGEGCRSVYAGLRGLASSALPVDPGTCRFAFEPWDAALRLRAESRWAPEVQLGMAVLHRNGGSEAPDRCQADCVRQIEERLRALAVQPHAWSESTSVGVVQQAPRSVEREAA